MSLAERMLSLFRGRFDHVAVGRDKGFEPVHLPGGLKAEWLEERHLAGKQCLGFYLLTEQSQCFCSCVDFDNKPENPDPAWRDKAEQFYFALSQAYLSPLVEVSQSGQAAHVWLFFAEPVDAWLVRAFWRAIGQRLETPVREIYPRQDRLTGKGIGNLIRYPLWGQSRFVEVESEWAALDPLAALDAARPTTGDELQLLAWQLGLGELKPEAQVVPPQAGQFGVLPIRVARLVSRDWTLLGRRWSGDTTGLNDPSRSGLAMSIAVELVRQFVPTPEIEAAVRCWMRKQGADAKAERDDWVSRTVAKAYDFIVSRKEEASTKPTTFADATIAYLGMLERDEEEHVGSGIEEIDRSIDGVAPGEMCVLAARPGHGKSAIAAQWLDNAAARGTVCLFNSEEMSAIELAKRRLLAITDLPQEHWSRETVPFLRDSAKAHYGQRAPIYVVEGCHSIDRIEEVIDQFCAIHGVRLVAVDYMQLLSAKSTDRYDAVTEISRRLKQAARRNNCAILALSQLNREIEKRADFEPKLSDLRESGQIEQDADLVLFCVWPCKISPKFGPDEYRITVAKRRNGPVRKDRIVTRFNPEKQTIGVPFQEIPPATAETEF